MLFSGITITSFAASYTVALALEACRLLVRSAWLRLVSLALVAAGLLAQTIHLYNLAREETAGGVLFARWYDWCLLAAWVLAAAYLGLSLRRPQWSLGIFLLPMVLALIVVAYLVRGAPAFQRDDAQRIWSMLHGITLLVGTAGVVLGFVSGVMYLVQSYRLKHKLPASSTFKLPSLEWLERMNEESLVISSACLALGLLTGIVLNLIQHARETVSVPWTEPAVWSSAVLLLWLAAAMLFNWLYKPARQGRKVAYLTLASFGFLALVLGLVLMTGHAASASPRRAGIGQSSVAAVSSRREQDAPATNVHSWRPTP
jgi:ABC-type uncharacterized transport system permease subunit